MPTIKTLAAFALAELVFVVASGCGSKTSGSNAAAGCQSYVDSYCALEATCNVTGAASCATSFDALVCVASDEPARCAAALDDWTACDTVPAGCGVEKIADLAQAQATCVAFVSQACAYYLRCGKYPDQASCASDLKLTKNIDCSKALAATDALSGCESELPTASCDADPVACGDVLTFMAN